MSMPEFPTPNPELTQQQALTMILSSIALEEVALSHIINAEGEKIQFVLSQNTCDKQSFDLEDVLAVNKSVSSLLEMVMQSQLILKNKMEKVLEFLPSPPKPNPRPCPTNLSCQPSCSSQSKYQGCFSVIPSFYCYCRPLQWSMNSMIGCSTIVSEDCTNILIPHAGQFMIEFCAELCETRILPQIIEIGIIGQGQQPLTKQFYLSSCHYQTIFSNNIIIDVPFSCARLYISFHIPSQDEVYVQQGKMTITKL